MTFLCAGIAILAVNWGLIGLIALVCGGLAWLIVARIMHTIQVRKLEEQESKLAPAKGKKFLKCPACGGQAKPIRGTRDKYECETCKAWSRGPRHSVRKTM